MKTVCPAAKRLENLEPYDPRYLPARIYLNANENPFGMPAAARARLLEAVEQEPLHRYPDPLAKRLRSAIAKSIGVKEEHIVLGNGGDELLFNLCLAYGGEGRTLLLTPPTFSVYATNALLTNTEVIEVPRACTIGPEGAMDFSLNEKEILAQVKRSNPSIIILTSPNNPTGDCIPLKFIQELLEATNAVVLVDHAYIEFASPGYDATHLLKEHANLAILRTLSKAYGLAGLRIGYLVAGDAITREFCKVRQPYSVDTLSALAALAALDAEDDARAKIECMVSERERLVKALGHKGLGLVLAPSEANYLLLKVPKAHEIWQKLYDDYGILVRDLSATPGLTNCLRVSIGTPEENDEFLAALGAILKLAH